MARNEEHLPEDIRDIAARLTEARATLTPLEADELSGRVRRRVARAPRRGARRLRRTSLAAILAAALMLTSGAGAVIAAGYFGGHSDGFFGGDSQVFQSFNFRHDRDASYCQYHGPQTITRVIPTFFGIFIITITFDCGRVVDVHISFIPYHLPHQFPHWGYEFDGGNQQQTNNVSVSTTAPTGTSSMTLTENGQHYTVPFNFNN